MKIFSKLVASAVLAVMFAGSAFAGSPHLPGETVEVVSVGSLQSTVMLKKTVAAKRGAGDAGETYRKIDVAAVGSAACDEQGCLVPEEIILSGNAFVFDTGDVVMQPNVGEYYLKADKVSTLMNSGHVDIYDAPLCGDVNGGCQGFVMIADIGGPDKMNAYGVDWIKKGLGQQKVVSLDVKKLSAQ